jgi:hypothetical protein
MTTSPFSSVRPCSRPKCSICTTAVLLITVGLWGRQPQPVPVEKFGTEFSVIGKLHSPLGAIVSVVGVVAKGPFKGYEGGLNLRVQQIQGRYYQKDIQILIAPYSQDWDEKPVLGGHLLSKPKIGETYEMQGYETGAFVGIPAGVTELSGALIQSTEYYFRTYFLVIKSARVDPIVYEPSMFSGEKALLSGVAQTVDGDAALVGDDWLVVVTRGKKWEAAIEGTTIESYGLYNPDATWKDDPKPQRRKFDLVDGWWKLVKLEDQLGKRVSLRGRAKSSNGVCYFDYRGTELYVDGLEQLPGWTPENHGSPMEIEGRLERARLPRLDQIYQKPDLDLADYFIVRDPSWRLLPELLAPERPFPPEAESSTRSQPKTVKTESVEKP